jgi:hypothetical protein
VITEALPNIASYGIDYDDGDADYEVKQRCVLPLTDED